jgi:hypothetical protein
MLIHHDERAWDQFDELTPIIKHVNTRYEIIIILTRYEYMAPGGQSRRQARAPMAIHFQRRALST